MDTVLLDGTQLSIEQVMAVAIGEPGAPAVRLTEAAAARVTRAAQAESRRQEAERSGDQRARDAALDELRELWRRHADLESAA